MRSTFSSDPTCGSATGSSRGRAGPAAAWGCPCSGQCICRRWPTLNGRCSWASSHCSSAASTRPRGSASTASTQSQRRTSSGCDTTWTRWGGSRRAPTPYFSPTRRFCAADARRGNLSFRGLFRSLGGALATEAPPKKPTGSHARPRVSVTMLAANKPEPFERQELREPLKEKVPLTVQEQVQPGHEHVREEPPPRVR